MLKLKRILVTGSDGFIAKNLIEHLKANNYEVLLFNKKSTTKSLENYIKKADFIFHLAGENRPKDLKKFKKNNILLTEKICNIARRVNSVPICFSSSTQALLNNSYGKSKMSAEKIIHNYSKKTSQNTYIYRLPGVFGKWSKPNYNSVVSTFCNNIANDIDIYVHDTNAVIELVYI